MVFSCLMKLGFVFIQRQLRTGIRKNIINFKHLKNRQKNYVIPSQLAVVSKLTEMKRFQIKCLKIRNYFVSL